MARGLICAGARVRHALARGALILGSGSLMGSFPALMGSLIPGWLAGATPAHAASFNCSRARTATEKAICASPQLSAAEDRMAAAYRAWIGAAPGAFRAGITESQLAWLENMDARCTAQGAGLGACVEEGERRRAEALEQMVLQRNGVTFVWRTITRTAHDYPDQMPIEGEQRPGFGTLSASWPQAIDSSPQWSAWNRGIETAARGRSSAEEPAVAAWTAQAGSDNAVSVEIGSVSPRLVTATIHATWDGHSINGPESESVEFNWLLDQRRELGPEDLFRPGSGWESVVERRTDTYLRGLLGSGACPAYREFFSADNPALHGIELDPRNWRLEPGGLGIRFQLYTDPSNPECTPEAFRMSWAELQPYLRPGFPVPGGS